MRVLLAPDKFKGTFTAAEVCFHLAEGIRLEVPGAAIESHPMADGGEGTLDVVLAARGGGRHVVRVPGPLGGTVSRPTGLLEDGTVLIESALFCGPAALGGRDPDPLKASTRGLGVAIRWWLDRAPSKISVGLGGSMTVDGGLGMARALGYEPRDRSGRPLEGTGGDLLVLSCIVPPGNPTISTEITALADVSHRITGPSGAARTFGPQKGASREQVEQLDRGLENLVTVLSRDLGMDVEHLNGGGAAGGLGAALAAFLGARIVPGAAAVAEMTGLRGAVERADLVVTGEGAFDGCHEGKVAGEVARLCEVLGRPLAIVCGRSVGPRPAGRVTILDLGESVDPVRLRWAGKALARGGFSRG